MTRTLLCLLVAATACADPSAPPPDPAERREVVAMTALPNPDLDLLFVIDNSGSMLEEQALLAASFPRMMDVLAELEGGIPNLHIAVVTSDLGAASLANPAGSTEGIFGCSGAGAAGRFHTGDLALPEPYLIDIADGAGGRTRNFSGSLRDAFTTLASVGGQGCGFEQHLGAMERALDEPSNGAFLRQDANLAIVFLADEDDCTAATDEVFAETNGTTGVRESFRCTRFGLTCDQDVNEPGVKTNCVPRSDSPLIADPQPFIDALVARKADPRQIMVAAIIGPADPIVVEMRPPPSSPDPIPTLAASCSVSVAPSEPNPSGVSTAQPAVRLAAFANAFEGRSVVSTICAEDLAASLTGIGATAKKLVGDPCIDATLLADTSAAPGTQPSCEVLDITDGTETTVPACTDAGGDCYELVRDPATCPRQAENLRVSLRRGSAASAGTWTHVRCIPRA